MRRSELLLMLLPCLFLAGIALVLHNRENPERVGASQNAPSSGPLQLVVKSIEDISPSTNDIAAGYDAKVRVLLGHKGKTPVRWGSNGFGSFFSDTRLLVQRNGKWVRLMDNNEKEFKGYGIPIEINGFQKEHNAYQFAFPLRLRELPANYGAVILQSDWFYNAGNSGYSAVGQSSFTFLRRVGAPHAGARITVRHSGETIVLPQVSHDPQIEVRRVVVRPLTKQEKIEYAGNDTKVEFHVFYRGPLDTEKSISVGNAGRVYLRDTNGKEHNYNILRTGEHSDRETMRRKIVPYYFNLRQASLRGKVVLHAKLQAGNYWPLDVQAVVRR